MQLIHNIFVDIRTPLTCMVGYLVRSGLVRAFWINAATLLVIVGATEAWFLVQASDSPEERYEGRYTQDYFVDHALLGYGPASGGQFPVRRFVGEEKLYETTYSINSYGLRITPMPKDPHPKTSVLFFGGSVTFGEGVADNESMPYRVGELAHLSHQVYNFGFHGYGPHQMLATLEFGLYADIVTERVSHVIYQAIPAHVLRVRGLAPWDRRGPWYTRNHRGEVGYAGSFADSRGHLLNSLLPLLQRSSLYQRIFGLQRAMTKDDIGIYVAVVARARDLVRNLFPGSEFHVLLWANEGDSLSSGILDGFNEAGIRTHRTSDSLPEYNRSPKTYQIGAYDAHPNALAHDLIAKYLRTEILVEHE